MDQDLLDHHQCTSTHGKPCQSSRPDDSGVDFHFSFKLKN
ncbi:hypothetical protein SynMINOS11_02632 [Synechococcus sp. Minos11]|nr:hypothetical protein SynMINOS11_02632 [Synechococcus sp. Minos11]